MGPGMGPFAGDRRSGVRQDLEDLAWSSGGPPCALEGLDVVGEDGPDGSHLDSVQALSGQHPPHVGPGGFELGGGFGNGK